jgi:phosphoribosylformylglycinamidine synthase
MILHLSGAPALSDFRLKKYIAQLQAIVPAVCGLQAFYEYFIDTIEPLDSIQLDRFNQLLNAVLLPPRKFSNFASLCLIVPRVGTLSPWSSKATDIAKFCGFPSVNRLERGISFYVETQDAALDQTTLFEISKVLHDRMLEMVFYSFENIHALFLTTDPDPLTEIDVVHRGQSAVSASNELWGLALSEAEVRYFFKTFESLNRNPTDVELMMFAQANSEHCRHKIFNAKWNIGGVEQTDSLFSMIRNTYEKNPQGVLSAYKDNAAVFAGYNGKRFLCDAKTHMYASQSEPIHVLIKVETHNHPTAIAPFPGAATGSGGEIRDEGATGRGAKPKASLVGFAVSHLRIPDFPQPWEAVLKKPAHIASSLEIMLSGPLGSAAFNNEFGRPNICGYFRTFEYQDPHHSHILRSYHKPIMLAGGMGSVRAMHTHKNKIAPEDLLIVLGGPALLIGLGGGSASSLQGDSHRVEQDFASVQRPNPEMQRRCQEVIDQCCALGAENPIVAIHDVGAGGLSNALPELVHESERGAHIQLRAIPSDDPHLSPLEIWCNEAQERYVLALKPDNLEVFTAIAQRERCPFAVVGHATEKETLRVEDQYFQNNPIDMSMAVLFGKPPKLEINEQRSAFFYTPDMTTDHLLAQFSKQDLKVSIQEIIQRVLRFPTVASKSFLITIGDRTVGGLVARDPMVGPWQVPVADVGVTAADFEGYHGEAMAIGERTPLGIIHAKAAARMAVGEAITNITAASIEKISDIKLSANWMAATKFPGEKIALFDAVKAVGLEICPALGISIPVGKDSLSMQMDWSLDGQLHTAAAPVSPLISAFAPVVDIRKTLTPELSRDSSTELWLIDLGAGKNRLGGSALMQVYGYLGDTCPDLDSAVDLGNFFSVIQLLNQSNLLLAYHDRSDGGVWTTLCEMAFAAHVGLQIQVPVNQNPIAFLYNEELGAVIQVSAQAKTEVKAILRAHHLEHYVIPIATLSEDDSVTITQGDAQLFSQSRAVLQQLWSETSFHMQLLRDHPEAAKEEFSLHTDENNKGLRVLLTFDPLKEVTAPSLVGTRPRIAILREQGVNGQLEMAAAFTRAGFDCVDVHMSDLLSGQVSLDAFIGFVAVGGFSYGDVLGAGRGWANSILHNAQLCDAFAAFFARTDTFALGVCNGCQMMAYLKSLIPGAAHWPTFIRNRSEQFEARFSMVEIAASPSILFAGMQGSQLPIAIAHGEGRAHWPDSQTYQLFQQTSAVALRYVDHQGKPTAHYPENPNGSPAGIAGVTNEDGRFTLLMPHPERVFRTVQWSWHPKEWGENSPWMRIFENLRVFVG